MPRHDVHRVINHRHHPYKVHYQPQLSSYHLGPIAPEEPQLNSYGPHTQIQLSTKNAQPQITLNEPFYDELWHPGSPQPQTEMSMTQLAASPMALSHIEPLRESSLVPFGFEQPPVEHVYPNSSNTFIAFNDTAPETQFNGIASGDVAEQAIDETTENNICIRSVFSEGAYSNREQVRDVSNVEMEIETEEKKIEIELSDAEYVRHRIIANRSKGRKTMIIGYNAETNNTEMTDFAEDEIARWKAVLPQREQKLVYPFKANNDFHEVESIEDVYWNTAFNKVYVIVKWVGCPPTENMHFDPFDTNNFRFGEFMGPIISSFFSKMLSFNQ